ncbi:MAG: VOC family protein [Acidimicrobiales bacterium]
MTARPPISLAHAVLYVRDLDKMIDFYSRVLGFEVSDRGPLGNRENSPEIVFLSQSPTDHHQIAFLPLRKDDTNRSNNVDHLAWRVASLDEVRRFRDLVSAEPEVSDITPMSHGNAWSVYFRDPEGNRHEIFCDSPFAVSQPQGRAVDLDLSVEALTAATEAEFGGEPGFGALEEYYAGRAARLGSGS